MGGRNDRDDLEFLRRTVRRSAVFNLFTLVRKARVEVARVNDLEQAA
jgi:plasmid stabilization system protein ParE